MNHLIEQFHQQGLLDAPSAERARVFLAEGKTLEEAILAADGVSEESLLRALAQMFDLQFVDLDKNPPTREFLAGFPAGILVRHQVVPVMDHDGVVTVAASRVSNTTALDELRLITGKEFQLALATTSEIDRTLKRW